MERFSWINLGKYDCLIQDFSNGTPTELKTWIEESHRHIVTHGKKNKIIVLTNIENVKFDKETTHILSQYAEKNKPYVTQSSIYGINVYHKVALDSISKITGRNFMIFKDKAKALEWVDTLL